ncbi:MULTISPECIES: Rieske 2Fe-2S domain-containing protein [unclassified Aeromicrobium]|jgi:ubiquinol-cytochrome c reductase iron-sulfur subunit|uniref:cytochrome bc1 complex Rieske iron-sulfur subunit n=1 Tax=unclassified Aeromicrobium TaxID=2633570 RepID=UPI000AF4D9F7|nr:MULTISPECIES: Rieske 2Fe-2S domain-containing protein [unclassified Aeromicrobium]MCO7240059.1 Rieske 2Fe-2S domain-containing protein [Aeromicrobium sp. CnD17-E]MDR6119149.1 ubiquinol-cytochrome c reductase iron-sulfur subunit [Aeromicrobium sp. SORGH_AS_0981]
MSDEIQSHDSSSTPVRTEPVQDPGLQPHQWRPTDVDPAQERRAERQISGMFTVAALLFVLFAVSYFAIDSDQTFLNWSASNFALGATLGGGLLLIGVGIIQWAKKLMGDHEMVEMRHPARSSAEDREAVMADINAGLQESGVGRRPLIRNSLFLSVGALAVPSVVLLRDLGPLPHGQDETVWKKGMRVVNDVSGLPIRPEEIEVGQLINAEPAVFFPAEGEEEAEVHGHELLAAKSKAAIIVVRMRPEDITPSEGRENWGIDGILCYSKICTHVGCPISLWEQQTHHLLCPCHQSTFDLADNGKVIFGPAHRPLPQLPLGVDSEGYIIAMSDFPEIVAPSYPELARDQKRLDGES